MKNSIKWFLSYLGCVLLFSIVYWGAWHLKPDSFIINSQLNIRPFQSIDDFLWRDEPNYQTSTHVNLSQFKREYDTYYVKITEAEQQIQNIELEHKNLELRLLELDKKRNSEIDVNFKKYDQKKLEPFKNIEKELEKELAEIEGRLPEEVRTKDDLEVIKEVGAKRVELAKAKYNSAVQASVNISQDITGFMSNETWDGYRDVSDARKKLYQERYMYQKKIGDTRIKVIDALKNDRDLIRGRVGWSDFVFFSIGISTTTTFGDLVANDVITKSLVSIQLFGCLILVAGFLGSVMKQS